MLVCVTIMALTNTQRAPDTAGFVEDLQARGRYTFSDADARSALALSDVALANALRRLRQSGRIVSPRRGFHVIVPTEYRSAGAPPPPWFIDDLMSYIGQPYYVGLLSAAAVHGASHEQSMAFQVVTDRPTRRAVAGRARIEFHASSIVGGTPCVDVPTDTDSMRVSTPEATAFDLVRFARACGGWGNVASVLTELAERLDGARLDALAEAYRTPDIQRLGFLLDAAGHPRLADPLLRALGSRRFRPVLLAVDEPQGEAVSTVPWRIVPNVDLEVEP